MKENSGDLLNQLADQLFIYSKCQLQGQLPCFLTAAPGKSNTTPSYVEFLLAFQTCIFSAALGKQESPHQHSHSILGHPAQISSYSEKALAHFQDLLGMVLTSLSSSHPFTQPDEFISRVMSNSALALLPMLSLSILALLDKNNLENYVGVFMVSYIMQILQHMAAIQKLLRVSLDNVEIMEKQFIILTTQHPYTYCLC